MLAQSLIRVCIGIHAASLHTEKLLHRKAFTQRSLYTQQAGESFTHRSFYTLQTFTHGQLLHRASSCTEKLSRREDFTRRSFYTQKLLHAASFYTASFYTELGKLLFTESFYTEQAFTQSKLLHREAFTQRSSYAQQTSSHTSFTHSQLLHREAFTQRNNLDAVITMRSAKAELQSTIEVCATASEFAAPKPNEAKAKKKRF